MSRRITPNNHSNVLSHLSETFDQLLSAFEEGPHFKLSEFSTREWTPKVDIKEESNQYVIFVDVPGIKPSDIDISIEQNILKIKGQRAFEQKEEKENYLRVERSSGSFMRELMLPNSIDTDKIKAKTEHGVLSIILPKSSAHPGRKIKIEN